MRRIIIIFFLVFFSTHNLIFSQKATDNVFYLSLDSKKKCGNNFMKKIKNNISFQMIDCQNETIEYFSIDKKSKIDTLHKSFLNNVKFSSIERLNELNWQEHKSFFAGKEEKSVFLKNPIYIIKKVDENKIVRYKVNWLSRVLQTTIED